MSNLQAREAMVDNQIRPADVIDYKILEAFLNTKRESFVPEGKLSQAYGEYEIEFAPSRRMMRPMALAKLLQTARPQKDEDVLLIGAGTGYEVAIVSQLCNSVFSVEKSSALIKKAEAILAEEGYDNAILLKGDLKKGAADAGPFDLIIFNGSIQSWPEALAEQLKENGRIIAIFEHEGVYNAKMLFKSGDQIFEKLYFQCAAPALPGFEKKTEFAI